MRYFILFYVAARCIAWLLSASFRLGGATALFIIGLFRRPKQIPQVDPTKDANSVRSLYKE